jgi:acyl-CoA synthetase (AMP-forming)/AMP-acid ligase II
MDKIWLNSYPPGVPYDIDPSEYSSLSHLLDESFKRNAAQPFCVCMDRWMTYGELDRFSAGFGAWLQTRNLEPDARVALMLPNIPQFPVVMSGILRSGYTCVNVNPLYTARELQHQLADSGASVIVILENFASTLAEIIDQTSIQHVVVASLGDLLGFWYGRWVTFAVRHLAKLVPAYRFDASSKVSFTSFVSVLDEAQTLSLRPAVATPDSIAFLQYTGGTTGVSKGAMLTHRNVIAAVLQADAWFAPAVAKVGEARSINSIAALPLYHIFALTLCVLAIRWGAHLTLIPNPRDLDGFIRVLRQRPFHILPAVNTLFNAVLQHPQSKNVDYSRLCLSQAGGMAASPSTAQAWKDLTGQIMIEGWGMSETCAIGTNNPVTADAFTGTIGLPLPSIELVIKDEGGCSLPAGSAGEICVRGPNVMTGYYKQPDENAKAFTPDGYLRTGDIGLMDSNGYTRIVDRKKDMILVSGFNVFPNELENTISLCPGVLECAAVGVPDPQQGESVKVFIVRSNAMLSEEDVDQFCFANLTGYKRPKYIEFRDELPKSNVGKILRRELRDS